MLKLLALFILVPAVELALLIELGQYIGTLATLGVIAVTGVLGAALARHQGLSVLRKMRAEVADGRLPAAPLADGVMILVAGAVLMTPGLLTDACGFLLLLPPVRGAIRRYLLRRLERSVSEGRTSVVIDIEGDHL